MMRNHKSFLDNLCCKFLLCPPNSFGIQGKFRFSQILWDADRPTSTSLRLSETEDKHHKRAFFIFFFFFLILHTLGLTVFLEKRQEWQAFLKGFSRRFCFLFLFSTGLISAATRKWNLSSIMTKETHSPCLAVPPAVPLMSGLTLVPEWGDC